jgi:uncharacterized protein YpmB
MNLKKSDKIIAIVAVVILIIAAIGVVLYADREPDEVEPTTKSKEYAVEWIRSEGNLNIAESVGSEAYTTPFTITASSKPDSVLTSVNVLITWDDTITKNGLLNKGLDKITTKMALKGEDPKEYTATGMGNKTLTFSVFSKPQDENIEDAKDLTEANQMISEEYKNMDSADFDVEVTWTKGEKFSLRLGRLLNFLKDKGEDFKFEITFEYYYPDVHEVGDDGGDDSNRETNIQTVYGATPYVSTSYIGFH